MTFFEFETRSVLVEEFFVSTLVFSTFVQSVVFQLRVSTLQRTVGGWGLLRATGASGLGISAGVLLAFVIAQAVVGILGTGALLASQAHMGRPIPPDLVALLVLVLAKILLIGGSHTAIAALLGRTWAVLGMLASYILGQLSELVYGRGGVWLGDFVFSVVPDLQPLGLAERGADLAVSAPVLLYAVLYALFCVLVASVGGSRESALARAG